MSYHAVPARAWLWWLTAAQEASCERQDSNLSDRDCRGHYGRGGVPRSAILRAVAMDRVFRSGQTLSPDRAGPRLPRTGSAVGGCQLGDMGAGRGAPGLGLARGVVQG